MVLHHCHTPDGETENGDETARNARLGRWLFAGYLVLYVGYMAMVAFWPDVMRRLPAGGVNTAVWYGFGLIAAAILLSLVYGWLCRARTTE